MGSTVARYTCVYTHMCITSNWTWWEMPLSKITSNQKQIKCLKEKRPEYK